MPIFWSSSSSTSTSDYGYWNNTVYWFYDDEWHLQEEDEPKKERKLGFFND